jgi:hypothetical protein
MAVNTISLEEKDIDILHQIKKANIVLQNNLRRNKEI